MDNEYNEEINKEQEDFKEFILNKMKEMALISHMIQNAPRDEKGHPVADIIGIKNIGLFYVYSN